MEIQFQKEKVMKVLPPTKTIKTKARRKKVVNNKFIGVRQRPSGRWVAEIKDTTQKIRMWLGTFESAEAAARSYDEAACLLRGSNTRTNFHGTPLSSNSPLAYRITNLLNNKKNINTAAADDAKPPKQQQQQESSSSSASDDCLLFDDVYKPDLGGVDDHDAAWGGSTVADHNNSSSSSSSSFSFWAQEMMLELPHHNTNPSDTAEAAEEEELSEFERMKVERQISASLYAINGLHQYMETVSSVYDPSESDAALWDLPPLCPLLT